MRIVNWILRLFGRQFIKMCFKIDKGNVIIPKGTVIKNIYSMGNTVKRMCSHKGEDVYVWVLFKIEGGV